MIASKRRARAPSRLCMRRPRCPSATRSGSFAANARHAASASNSDDVFAPNVASAATSGASSCTYAPCSRGSRLRGIVVEEDVPRWRVDVVELSRAHDPDEGGDGETDDDEREWQDDVERAHGFLRN